MVLVRHEDNVAVNLVLACQRLHDLLVGDLGDEEARNDPGCADTNVGETVAFSKSQSIEHEAHTNTRGAHLFSLNCGY